MHACVAVEGSVAAAAAVAAVAALSGMGLHAAGRISRMWLLNGAER